MRWPAIIVALFGCHGSVEESDTDVESSDTDVVEDTDAADTDLDDTDVEVPLTASLSGVVTDIDGDPVVNARVNVCRVVCKTTYTNKSGDYAFDALEAWTASFYVVPELGSPLLTAIVPFTLDDGEARQLDTVMLEPDTVAMPDTAEEVEVTDGLFLTAGADILEPAVFTELGDVLLGVAVPEEIRLPVEALEVEPLAMWYLGPFEATSEVGVGVRIRNDWGLTNDLTCSLYASSEPTEYTWLEAGELSVSEDEAFLEGDAALPILTTVVLGGCGP